MEDSDTSLTNLVLALIEHPTAIVGMFALLIAALGIIAQRRTSKEKNSLDFQANYLENQKVQDAWGHLRAFKDNKDPDKHNKLATEKGTDERKAAILLLNEWERAANAIHHGLFDSNFLYQAHSSTVIGLYKDLLPFIEIIQSTNPRYFVGFTKLAVRWQHKRALEFRKGIELKESLMNLNRTFFNFNQYLESHSNCCPKSYNFNRQLKEFEHSRNNFKRKHRKLYFSFIQRRWISIKDRLFKTNP